MALTLNRPDFTAAELNTAFTTVRNALSASMPSAIQTVTGQSNFSVIDVYDTGDAQDIGRSIVDRMDVVPTLISIANDRRAGFFSSRFVRTSNHVNDFFLIEVRNSISGPNFKSINVSNAIYRATRPSAFYGQSDFKINITGTGSTYINTILASDDKSLPTLLLRAKFYVATNTITVESYTQDSGLSDYSSNIYGSVERFNDSGFSGWNVGTGGTYSFTAFLTFSGYEYWGSGTGTTLGSIETFDTGWPEGISPPSRSSDSSDHFTDNLTSQINGIATTFTTTYPYETGTLKVYWNGQRQYSGTISELSSTTFSTTFTPTSGDVLIVDYETLSS